MPTLALAITESRTIFALFCTAYRLSDNYIDNQFYWANEMVNTISCAQGRVTIQATLHIVVAIGTTPTFSGLCADTRRATIRGIERLGAPPCRQNGITESCQRSPTSPRPVQ